jgi:hypothetical protein
LVATTAPLSCSESTLLTFTRSSSVLSTVLESAFQEHLFYFGSIWHDTVAEYKVSEGSSTWHQIGVWTRRNDTQSRFKVTKTCKLADCRWFARAGISYFNSRRVLGMTDMTIVIESNHSSWSSDKRDDRSLITTKWKCNSIF